ncbi:MAG TPA: GNAT family N-acetyltransferase [Actinomycetota bacterium]
MEIRPIRPEELPDALPLFAGYQRFYEVPEPNDEANLAFFARFCEPSGAGLLLGAWEDDDLVGFANLYWTFSSTRAVDAALMNDLFVAERARGLGAGRALIQAAAEAARARGCHHLEWYTAPDNVTARRLYDATGATRSEWLAYEIELT